MISIETELRPESTNPNTPDIRYSMVERVKRSLRRVAEIYRSGGASNLILSISDFIHYRALHLSRWVKYQTSGSTTEFEIDGTTSEFRTKTYTEFIRFRYLKQDEEDVLRDFLQNLAPDDYFFDIGANVGLYTCMAAKKLPHGEVVAFEPHPKNIESLEKNLECNEVAASIKPMALADERGSFRLKESGTEAGEGRHHLSTDEGKEGIAVQVDTLDSVVGSTGQSPTIVKIDVEGAEMDVLRGGSETLSSDECRLLYCEIHPNKLKQFGSSREDVERTIEEFGFQTTVLDKKEEGVLIVRGKK